MFINTEYMRRPYSHYNRKNDFSVVVPIAGLSLRAGSQGFSPATRLLLLENSRKIEPKQIPSHLIPRLLVVFTRQLKILVTTLQ